MFMLKYVVCHFGRKASDRIGCLYLIWSLSLKATYKSEAYTQHFHHWVGSWTTSSCQQLQIVKIIVSSAQMIGIKMHKS
jgi:hypothetical protein